VNPQALSPSLLPLSIKQLASFDGVGPRRVSLEESPPKQHLIIKINVFLVGCFYDIILVLLYHERIGGERFKGFRSDPNEDLRS
jgi:hypothetical protein